MENPTATEAADKRQARRTRKPRKSRPARRFGYLVAALVNLVILWIVNQFLDWGWPPFLTEDFADLLPILDVSLVATVVVNIIWIAGDPPWLRHVGQIGLNLINLIVTVRTWQIFPFDFSDYSSVWETVARVAIVVVLVGVVVGTVSEIVALFRHEGGDEDSGTPPYPAPASAGYSASDGDSRGDPTGQ